MLTKVMACIPLTFVKKILKKICLSGCIPFEQTDHWAASNHFTFLILPRWPVFGLSQKKKTLQALVLCLETPLNTWLGLM